MHTLKRWKSVELENWKIFGATAWNRTSIAYPQSETNGRQTVKLILCWNGRKMRSKERNQLEMKSRFENPKVYNKVNVNE